MVMKNLGKWLIGFSLGFSLSLSGKVSLAETTTNTETSQFNLFQSIILGMVQGLTEFLPISSSAHLKVVPVALGWGDPGVTFTAVIQLGSIAAVLWYFWGDLSSLTVGMIKAFKESNYQTQEFKMGLGIAVGTLPIIFFGILLKVFEPDWYDGNLRSLTAIALASIIMAFLLALAEYLGRQKRDFDHLTTKDGILMGLAQSLALIPGVSRSGSTITAALFINLERATAARFSFLLGIPAISLAGLVELKDVIDIGINNTEIFSLIVATISSAIFSYLAIAWLIEYLKKQNTWVFVWYRLIFGTIILLSIFINNK
jgi:undecaprenyl-diphosphatase